MRASSTHAAHKQPKRNNTRRHEHCSRQQFANFYCIDHADSPLRQFTIAAPLFRALCRFVIKAEFNPEIILKTPQP